MKTHIGRVNTGVFTMDYCSFGEGPGTFVILPGISIQSVVGLADAVAEAYSPLTDDFTVYLFDRRNELPETYSVHEMADDTAEALAQLGLDEVCVFGASQGGMVAMDMAIYHPELVKKLAVGSTAARLDEERYKVFKRFTDIAESRDAEALYLFFADMIMPEPAAKQSREACIQAAKTVTEGELIRFIELTEGMRALDLRDKLDGISCPLLLIHDRTDRIFGIDCAQEIIDRLSGRPDFRYYIYDGYGHASYDLAPDYKERLLGFMKEQAY
ncbi:MAG: alpha/beta hydrolase [Mogibacterium sp.]|nr:alpha/beta hydrolase [Mogibacterium sp.]